MQLILLIVNILVLLVVGIIWPIMTIMNACGYDLPCIDSKGEEEYKNLNKIKKIISYGTKAF
jgi:hypothetical protein